MKPNENFNLSVQDIDIIEQALLDKIEKLSVRRQTHADSTIKPVSENKRVIEIDAEIKVIYNLLGKIHNQKNWYRPKSEVYVSG